MVTNSLPVSVIATLQQTLEEMRWSSMWKQFVDPREQVFERFQPLFAPGHIPKLTEEEFKPFLYAEHNHHWSSLHRQGSRLCADMPKLRKALSTLLDESRPIQARLDEVAGAIKGFGKATITAILHVAHPEKYGVWNSTSEGALVALKLYPEFHRGETFGSCYAKINATLVQLSAVLEIDLWTLDGLWWKVQAGGDTAPIPMPPIDEYSGLGQQIGPLARPQIFGLERHLQDFLFDNWDNLEIGRDWAIYTLPEDDEAGYEFATSVGRIDILAKHRAHKKWLVVELKRNETSDSVVGQVLRYMGWIKQHLAEPGDDVHGLIVGHEGDDGLRYAVLTVPNLTFQVYEVEFRLKALPPIGKPME